jgi:hypothetical protein
LADSVFKRETREEETTPSNSLRNLVYSTVMRVEESDIRRHDKQTVTGNRNHVGYHK